MIEEKFKGRQYDAVVVMPSSNNLAKLDSFY